MSTYDYTVRRVEFRAFTGESLEQIKTEVLE